MKRKRFSEEPIIAILREHEAGVPTSTPVRRNERLEERHISLATQPEPARRRGHLHSGFIARTLHSKNLMEHTTQ